jgi:hypothetical protein
MTRFISVQVMGLQACFIMTWYLLMQISLSYWLERKATLHSLCVPFPSISVSNTGTAIFCTTHFLTSWTFNWIIIQHSVCSIGTWIQCELTAETCCLVQLVMHAFVSKIRALPELHYIAFFSRTHKSECNCIVTALLCTQYTFWSELHFRMDWWN